MARASAFAVLLLLLAACASAAVACSCPVYDATSLRAEFDRIALVEIVSFGPEFDGRSPIFSRPGRNRKVQMKVIEVFAGTWSPEEWIIEGGFESACSLNREVGTPFLLALSARDDIVSFCNTDSRQP